MFHRHARDEAVELLAIEDSFRIQHGADGHDMVRSHPLRDPVDGQEDLRVQHIAATAVIQQFPAALVALGLAVAIAACGSAPPTKTSSGGTAQPAYAAAIAFAKCMRSNGVPNFPDPTFQTGPGGGLGVRIGGPGIDPSSPAFKSAQQACGSIIGKGPGPGAPPAP